MHDAARRRVQTAILRANLSNETVGWIVVGPLLVLYANDLLGLSAERNALVLALAPLVACMRFPLLGCCA